MLQQTLVVGRATRSGRNCIAPMSATPITIHAYLAIGPSPIVSQIASDPSAPRTAAPVPLI